MEEGKSSFKLLTGKPTGKSPLGRSRRRWEDNIRIDLEEMDMGNWVDSAQDRGYWRALLKATLNVRVPCSISHGVSFYLIFRCTISYSTNIWWVIRLYDRCISFREHAENNSRISEITSSFWWIPLHTIIFPSAIVAKRQNQFLTLRGPEILTSNFSQILELYLPLCRTLVVKACVLLLAILPLDCAFR